MRAAKRKRGQRVRILPDKRDMARSALAFGVAGGCVAGCENCRFLWLCEGGEIGAEQSDKSDREEQTE